MKLFCATPLLLALSMISSYSAMAFTPMRLRSSGRTATRSLLKSTPSGSEEKTTKQMMAAAAAQMKNMTPEDLDKMVAEVDNMNPLQAGALKAMGMDPEMMKKTMTMMRDNPAMVENARKVMENMTPEQLMEQSRVAQQRMASMTPEEMDASNKVMSSIPKDQIDAAADVLKSQQSPSPLFTDDDENKEQAKIETGPGSSADPEVVDAMFRVAELLSDPPTGDCTFEGFASVPVIQLLSGNGEMDLSMKELKECWTNGALDSTRVNKEGFQSVWLEVQEYFEDCIVGEARKEAKKLVSMKKRDVPKNVSPPGNAPESTIGENLSSDQMKVVNDQVKNMSDGDVDMMLSSMENMSPAEEARMKAMGVDPSMMQKTANMMKNNPMMREAAQAMMKNMSPEQMLEASQQAQQQMAGMSKEEIEEAMNKIEEK